MKTAPKNLTIILSLVLGVILFAVGASAATGGAVLPGTGGIGVTVFYIVGIVLIVAAVFFFIYKKKKTDSK